MPLLLGIDLGTTGCKAVVYDDEGQALGEGSLEYGLITLSPTMIEQDPETWWQVTCQTVRNALAAAGADREAVRGLAVSSQGISFLLVDQAGRPLGNAINWLDQRGESEAADMEERAGAQRIFEITGKPGAGCYVLPKLLWLRRHRPDEWAAARGVLMAHDYLIYRLCGVRVTDHSMAGGTLLHDLRRLEWSDELLHAFDISPSVLPELRWAGSPAGHLLPDVAAELGLSSDVVVAVGGQDQKVAGLGAGIRDRAATVSLGTAAAIIQLMDSPAVHPDMSVATFAFVQAERWALEGAVGTAAGSLRWYRDTIAPGASYAQLDDEAAVSPAGCEGVRFYPYLNGAGSPHWMPGARGTFEGLSLATNRGHLTRAVLEGVAFQIRENLEMTQKIAGPAEEVIVFGGGAKSALWRAIIGDVLCRPIVSGSTPETAALGAAMLAGLGCGLFPSHEVARQRMLPPTTHRQPDPARAAEYDVLFADYRRVESALLAASAPLP